MRTKNIIFFIVFLFFCYSGQSQTPDATGSTNGDGSSSYWHDNTARKGLYVRKIKNGSSPKTAIAYLNDKKYYATGTNCYDLFNCSLTKDGNNFTIDPQASIEALNTLKREGVHLVRFNCGIYYDHELSFYTEHRDRYIDALRQIAAHAEKLKIGLIPSLIWNFSAVTDYYDEPYRCWGKTDSKTTRFLKRYTTDIVTALRSYKSIFAWEFGNEFNLQADLPNWQERFHTTDPEYRITGKDIGRAYRIFAETVRANDPESRMLLSGNATMRPSQYHQLTQNSWATDNTKQYRKISKLFNPGKINTVTEHVYELEREFSDRGKVSLDEQLSIAMNAARELGKVYVVGEFGGVLQTEEQYRKLYEAFFKAGVQISLIWNFSPQGNIEHSFRAQEERGQYIFTLIREYNAKHAQEQMSGQHADH